MNSTAAHDLLSGIAGATVSVYVGQPLDTIKTKLQISPSSYKNFLECAIETFRHDGIHGLYAGTIPSLIANVAENGILFMAYGRCQNFICLINNKSNREQLTSVENMAAGSFAAIFASLALCPTELVKCRIQTMNDLQRNKGNKTYKNISVIGVTRNILRTEGIRGFYHGLTATLARECPGYGFFFGGYELTRSFLRQNNEKKQDIGVFKTWISGGMAGICFWTFIFPVDVIKSRVQVYKPKIRMMRYTIDYVRNEGFTALYAGLLPTLIRAFIATGALFVTYEKMQSILNPSV